MRRRYKKEGARQAVLFLIGVNLVMYAIVISKGINTTNLIHYGGMYPAVINATGEYWRLLTAGFLHGGPMHLMVNMMSLYFVGTFLEQVLGTGRFLIVYLSSILLGNLASYAFGVNNIVSVGASSGIFGLFGIGILLSRLFPRNYAMKVNATQYMTVAALNIAVGFMGSNVDHFAHLGGLIGGLLMGYSMSLTRRQVAQRIIVSVVYIVLCIVLFAFGLASMGF